MSDAQNLSADAVLNQVAAVFADALGYDVEPKPSTRWAPSVSTRAFLAEITGTVTGTLVAALDPSEVAKHGDDGLAAASDAFGAALLSVPNLTVLDLSSGDAPVLGSTVSLVEDGVQTAVLGWVSKAAQAADSASEVAPTDQASTSPLQVTLAADLPYPSSAGGFKQFGEVSANSANPMRLLHDVRMRVTAELGRAELSVRELLGLAPGSVIELDRVAGSPIDVLVNDKLVARGEVVVIDEEFGVRIVEIVTGDES